jgi:hypothetical protein
MQFFRILVTSSLLRPNILLNILFPKTFNLYFILIARDYVSYPYKTANNIDPTVFCILIFTFLCRRREDKSF